MKRVALMPILLFFCLFGLSVHVSPVTAHQDDWWNDDWDYRITITIKEKSRKPLEDYQVLVKLNSTNFDFEKAHPGGADIRFINSGEELSYWIEEWNPVKEKARIWVKIPEIPAGGEKIIYMYYGNSNAKDGGDGDKTFEFFDDCDDPSDWTQKKESKQLHNYIVYHQHDYQPLDFVIEPTDSFVVTSTAKDIDSHYSVWTHHGLQFFGLFEDTEFDHYSLFGLDYGGSAKGYNSILKSSVGRDGKYTSVDAPGNTLLRWEIIKDGSDWTFKSTREDNDVEVYSYSKRFEVPSFRYIGFKSMASAGTITSELYDGGMRFRCVGRTGNTADIVYYNIFVRKYTDPEPTVTIGEKDLSVSSRDISFSDTSPEKGQMIIITADIHHKGELNISNVLVHFYSGDPTQRGKLIGSDRVFIEVNNSEKAEIEWNVTGGAEIYVFVDPDDGVAESDEDNNMAFRRLNVNEPNYSMYLIIGAIIVMCILGMIILFAVYKVVTYKKPSVDTKNVECPRCGMVLPSGTNECPVCGNKIK